MSYLVQIGLVAVVVSIACSLPGIFLVLRGSSMISDAITHTVLLGIVLTYFVVHDLNSPFLMVGATL
ncbi:MAG TPA: metal ABC transporter permease, partial [Alloiococcus sp.]|nr:metal ABC transporter permease [Alloiococcus sp.]